MRIRDYIDYDSGMVYIGVDPANRLVEITAFNIALLRTTAECHGKQSDHKGYVIRGITFTQYAYRALEIEGTDPVGLSDESQHGKDVVGSILEDCYNLFFVQELRGISGETILPCGTARSAIPARKASMS